MGDLEHVKRQILDRVRIEDVVSEHVMLRRRGTRLVGLCPFHSEKTPSFTVSPERGLFKCFGCGKGGDIFSFVQLRENLPFMEAMRLLADRAGVTLPSRGSAGASATEDGPNRSDLLKINDWAQRYFHTQLVQETTGRAAQEYLRTRGFSSATTERFGLGLAIDGPVTLQSAALRAGLSAAHLIAADLIRQDENGRTYDTFRQRLLFPIRDSSGRVVGFGGRTLIDDKAKYLNTRQNALFDKGRTLFGLDAARESITARKRVIVVEGYTDCLACHQAGFEETVATMGTALTEHHVDVLRRFADEIVLLFDSDDAGEAAADRAISLALPRCVGVRLARVPEGKDPGDYLPRAGAAAFSDVLKSAIEALEFKWLATQRRFQADSSDAKRREAVLAFVRVAADAVGARAVDAIQYGLLLNQIAHLLGIDRTQVAQLMERSRSTSSGAGTTPAATSPDVRSEEQAVWAHWLEVLLACPGAPSRMESWPDVSRISDRRDRRIAQALTEAARASASWGLADVLARCHEPGDAERIGELVERGCERGNFAATLELALERLRRGEAEGRMDGERRELSAPVVDGMRDHRHFAPRRFRRQALGVVSPSVGDALSVKPITE